MDKNRGGRPRHGEELKTAPLSIRIDPNLRAMLQEAARQNDRTVTREVEARLGDSFDAAERKMIDPELWARLLSVSRDRPVEDELNERLRLSFDDGLVVLPLSLEMRLRDVGRHRGHGLQEEAVERLGHSLIVDSFFGSSETSRLLRAIGNAIDAAEGRTGGKWHEDRQTWYAVRVAAVAIITANAPGEVGQPRPDEEALGERLLEARLEYNRAVATLHAFIYQHPELQAHDRDVAAGATDPAHIDPAVMQEAIDLDNEATEARTLFDLFSEQYEELASVRRSLNKAATDIAQEASREVLSTFRVTPAQRDLPLPLPPRADANERN